MSLYDFAQPVWLHQFRSSTEAHRHMSGVTSPTFRCRCCGGAKRIAGRKPVTPKHPKDGFRCAECVAKTQ